MNCICGKELVEVLVDLTRKADGKAAECITAEHCDECNHYYIDFGGISFE
jgi:hypothetical protein